METVYINGVRMRVIKFPAGEGKTSSFWNVIKTRIRPCHNVKVLVGHLQRKRALGSVPYGVEPIPRNY